MLLHLTLSPWMSRARIASASDTPSPLPELWARLVEHRLEPLSASWDAQANGLRLELIATEAAASSAVTQARRIAEAATWDRFGATTIRVTALTEELAFA